eukprot:403356770
MNILIYNQDNIKLPDEYDSETNDNDDEMYGHGNSTIEKSMNHKKQEDRFISIRATDNQKRGDIMSVYAMHSDDFESKTIIPIGQNEKMTQFVMVMSDQLQQKYEQFYGLTSFQAIELWKVKDIYSYKKSAQSSAALKNSQTQIQIQGKVKDQLKANDYIMCKVDSADIWLKLKIQILSPHKSLETGVEMKVDKELIGKSLTEIIQKYCIDIWNNYCQSILHKKGGKQNVKGSQAQLQQLKDMLYVLTDFKVIRFVQSQVIHTPKVKSGVASHLSVSRILERKTINKKLIQELSEDLKIGDMFNYQENELRVQCRFQTMKQLFQLQYPLLKLQTDNNLDVLSTDRKMPLTSQKSQKNLVQALQSDRRFSGRFGRITTQVDRKQINYLDQSSKLENQNPIFSTSMPVGTNILGSQYDSNKDMKLDHIDNSSLVEEDLLSKDEPNSLSKQNQESQTFMQLTVHEETSSPDKITNEHNYNRATTNGLFSRQSTKMTRLTQPKNVNSPKEEMTFGDRATQAKHQFQQSKQLIQNPEHQQYGYQQQQSLQLQVQQQQPFKPNHLLNHIILPKKYNFRFQEEDISGIKDTSQRLSTSVDLVTNFDFQQNLNYHNYHHNTTRNFDYQGKHQKRLIEIEEEAQDQSHYDSTTRKPLSRKLTDLELDSKSGRLASQNVQQFGSQQSPNNSVAQSNANSKRNQESSLVKQKTSTFQVIEEEEEKYDIDASPKTQGFFKRRVTKKRTADFNMMNFKKQGDRTDSNENINQRNGDLLLMYQNSKIKQPLLDSFPDTDRNTNKSKSRLNLHQTINVELDNNQKRTDLIGSNTKEGFKFSSVTNRESYSNLSQSNSHTALGIGSGAQDSQLKELLSNKNKNDAAFTRLQGQAHGHQKKASIFNNFINYIRGTPRQQQALKKPLVKQVNAQRPQDEDQLTDEQMIQKLNLQEQFKFLLKIEEYQVITIPLTRNFYLLEKQIDDKSESEFYGMGIGGIEFMLTEENQIKSRNKRRNCAILIGLVFLTILITVALVLVLNQEQ